MKRILMKGNEALAEAAIQAGCKCFFAYPITPQTEIGAYLSKNMKDRDFTFLQAESEIAAVNMVLGASAAGVRTMTSSSSPGISLKSEGISYIAGSDLPCVIVNVQRGGPGLGGIQPSQSDYWQATRALGHGDFQLMVYAPSSVQETIDMTYTAFENADRFRMPVMILTDGFLGQMMEPVTFPDTTPSVLNKEWACTGHENKRSHNVVTSLYLKPDDLEESVRRRFRKYDMIKAECTQAESFMCDDAQIVLCAYGATSRVVKSAVRRAREEGIRAGLFRPKTLWPFPEEELRKSCSNAGYVLCTEMSMGQMTDDIRLALNCSLPVGFYGRTGGNIPSPDEILQQIKIISEKGEI